MKITTITTTINVPTVLRKHREMDADVDFIIAGDVTSPHNEINDIVEEVGNSRYLHPDDQTRWKSSQAIGWKCIQRRNIAILEAIKGGADVIVTIDDDNMPLSAYFYEIIRGLIGTRADRRVYSNSTGWSDPWLRMQHGGPVNRFHHRGFPYSQRSKAENVTLRQSFEPVEIGVVAGFAAGDPDIDAIERIVSRPFVHPQSLSSDAHNGFALAPGTWAPFNSQNTAYKVELAPYLMCWPHVGRYDDIWASYLCRTVMDQIGLVVHYGPPVVMQDRNEHDLWKDVEQELLGYRRTDELCKLLRDIPVHPEHDSFRSVLSRVYDELRTQAIVPDATLHAMLAWMDDIDTAYEERNNA